MTSNTHLPVTLEAGAWERAHGLFGRPALLRNETCNEFQRLFEDLARDLKPTNAVELMCIWEATELTFELRRYRRARNYKLVHHNRLTPGGIGEKISNSVYENLKGHATVEQIIAGIEARRLNLIHSVYRFRELGRRDLTARLQEIDGEFVPVEPGTAVATAA